jgi:hypothetical protein
MNRPFFLLITCVCVLYYVPFMCLVLTFDLWLNTQALEIKVENI